MDFSFLVAFAAGIFFLVLFVFKRRIKSKQFPPGPLSLPFIGGLYALGTKPYTKLTELKKKYGSIIGMDFATFKGIVINDTETIKKVFSLPEFQSRPKFEAPHITRGQQATGIVWSSGKIHEEQRSFTLKNLKVFGANRKGMEVLIIKQLEHTFKVLDKQLGKPVVNFQLFDTTVVGALWTVISGECAREDDERFQTILKLNSKLTEGFNFFVCFFPTMAKLFPNFSGWNGLIQGNAQIEKFVKEKIESHKNVPFDEEPKDFIGSLFQKLKDTTDVDSTFFGENGKINMIHAVCDLLAAGTETVSTVLSWVLAIAIRYPEKQERLQKEIDRVIGTKTPSLADRSQLPYVEAFLLEVLRFSSVLPLGVTHSTSEDVRFENYLIPKDTIVIANSYSMLHDPEHWEEPDSFKPERFLNEDGSAILRNISRNVDWIFGHGKRMCVGVSLAKDELFLFITGLSQRYTFKPDPKCNYKPEIDADLGATLVPKRHTVIISKR